MKGLFLIRFSVLFLLITTFAFTLNFPSKAQDSRQLKLEELYNELKELEDLRDYFESRIKTVESGDFIFVPDGDLSPWRFRVVKQEEIENKIAQGVASGHITAEKAVERAKMYGRTSGLIKKNLKDMVKELEEKIDKKEDKISALQTQRELYPRTEHTLKLSGTGKWSTVTGIRGPFLVEIDTNKGMFTCKFSGKGNVNAYLVTSSGNCNGSFKGTINKGQIVSGTLNGALHMSANIRGVRSYNRNGTIKGSIEGTALKGSFIIPKSTVETGEQGTFSATLNIAPAN